MIETAIVMPLLVFMILGLLQLGLLQQGRSMAKYAAFKAVRAGSIHSASVEVMKNAALAVLLPVVGYEGSKIELYNRTRNATDLDAAWQRMRSNTHSGTNLEVVEVMICNPTSRSFNTQSVDFDDPAVMGAADDWEMMDKGKLSIQLTFNYRLVIPFANMMIWNITRAQQIGENLIRTVRIGNSTTSFKDKIGGVTEKVDAYGPQKKYFLPIRTNFAMRMQSNFLQDRFGDLPSENKCILNFAKK